MTQDPLWFWLDIIVGAIMGGMIGFVVGYAKGSRER